MKLTHVGVVGRGQHRAGVVTDLVLHGINAVLVDLSDEILKKAEAEVRRNIRFASLFSKTLPGSHAKRLEAPPLTTELKDVASMRLRDPRTVTENWDIKEKRLREAERRCLRKSVSAPIPRALITQIGAATSARPMWWESTHESAPL